MEAEISETLTESANTSGIATGLVCLFLTVAAHTRRRDAQRPEHFGSSLLLYHLCTTITEYYSIKCDATQNVRKKQILTTRTKTEEMLSVKRRQDLQFAPVTTHAVLVSAQSRRNVIIQRPESSGC